MSIKENLLALKREIPQEVKLVAVSKTHPAEVVMEAYDAGHRIFGENKVQELVGKYEILPKDIEWHLIGHLQTNKVKYIAPFVSLIHSVDSLKLLTVINREAKRNQRVIDCLLQIHIAKEETKFGLSFEDTRAILLSDEFASFQNIRIVGLMGMATFTSNEKQISAEFSLLREYFEKIRDEHFAHEPSFKELSMGMSGDYPLALRQGSTIVRIGSKIFGARSYRSDKN